MLAHKTLYWAEVGMIKENVFALCMIVIFQLNDSLSVFILIEVGNWSEQIISVLGAMHFNMPTPLTPFKCRSSTPLSPAVGPLIQWSLQR